MATRIDRIEARVEHGRAERIRYAAQLARKSVSSFVVDAATDRAEQVIGDQKQTSVPPDFFNKLLRALDEPGQPAPALKKAAKRSGTVKHR